MALIITIVNRSELAPVSDYEANVYVNQRLIAGPIWVRKHKRADGWVKLVEMFLKQAKAVER